MPLFGTRMNTISGTNYYNIDLRPTGPLDNRGFKYFESKQSRKLTEVNLIDNFNLPRDWKSNISLDVALKNNFALSLEGRIQKNYERIVVPVHK
jgi:hypothetical protein